MNYGVTYAIVILINVNVLYNINKYDDDTWHPHFTPSLGNDIYIIYSPINLVLVWDTYMIHYEDYNDYIHHGPCMLRIPPASHWRWQLLLQRCTRSRCQVVKSHDEMRSRCGFMPSSMMLNLGDSCSKQLNLWQILIKQSQDEQHEPTVYETIKSTYFKMYFRILQHAEPN